MTADPGPTARQVVADFIRRSGRDRRWLDALLIFSTIIAGFVAIGLVAQSVYAFGDLVLTFFLAWLLAFLITPVAVFLRRLVPFLPEALAVVFVYLVVLVGAISGIVLLASSLATSIAQFIQNVPEIQQNLAGILAPWQARLDGLWLQVDLAAQVQAILDFLKSSAGELARPLQDVAVASVGVIGNVLLIFILSVYLAVDREKIVRFIELMTPAGYRGELEFLRTSVNRSFGGFVRGQILVGLAYGAMAVVTSLVFGVPLAALTSAVVGVLMAIPFFGPFVAWAPPVLAALILSPDSLLPVTAAMVVGWMVVMNVLQPRLMAGAVGLDPFVVLASVLIGLKVAGVAGAIFGIPIAAILTGFFWHLVHANAGGEVARHAEERLAAQELLPADPGPTPTSGSHATG